MVHEFVAVLFGDLLLATLDDVIDEFDDLTAFQTHHMVMVVLLGHLENRVTTVEIVTNHKARRLELSQYAVDGRQANILARIDQCFIHFFCAKVVLARSIFENLQDLDARQGHF